MTDINMNAYYSLILQKIREETDRVAKMRYESIYVGLNVSRVLSQDQPREKFEQAVTLAAHSINRVMPGENTEAVILSDIKFFMDPADEVLAKLETPASAAEAEEKRERDTQFFTNKSIGVLRIKDAVNAVLDQNLRWHYQEIFDQMVRRETLYHAGSTPVVLRPVIRKIAEQFMFEGDDKEAILARDEQFFIDAIFPFVKPQAATDNDDFKTAEEGLARIDAAIKKLHETQSIAAWDYELIRNTLSYQQVLDPSSTPETLRSAIEAVIRHYYNGTTASLDREVDFFMDALYPPEELVAAIDSPEIVDADDHIRIDDPVIGQATPVILSQSFLDYARQKMALQSPGLFMDRKDHDRRLKMLDVLAQKRDEWRLEEDVDLRPLLNRATHQAAEDLHQQINDNLINADAQHFIRLTTEYANQQSQPADVQSVQQQVAAKPDFLQWVRARLAVETPILRDDRAAIARRLQMVDILAERDIYWPFALDREKRSMLNDATKQAVAKLNAAMDDSGRGRYYDFDAGILNGDVSYFINQYNKYRLEPDTMQPDVETSNTAAPSAAKSSPADEKTLREKFQAEVGDLLEEANEYYRKEHTRRYLAGVHMALESISKRPPENLSASTSDTFNEALRWHSLAPDAKKQAIDILLNVMKKLGYGPGADQTVFGGEDHPFIRSMEAFVVKRGTHYGAPNYPRTAQKLLDKLRGIPELNEETVMGALGEVYKGIDDKQGAADRKKVGEIWKANKVA